MRIPRVLTQREPITSEATVARGGAQQPQEKKPVKVRSRAAVFAIKSFFFTTIHHHYYHINLAAPKKPNHRLRADGL